MGTDCQPPCCGRRFGRTFRYKVHSCHSRRGIKRLLLCQTRYDGNANLPIALRHWAVVSRCLEGTWCRNIQVSGGPTAVKESHSFVTSTVDNTDERPASPFVARYALYRKAACSVGLDAVSTFRRSVAALRHRRPWFDLRPVCVGFVVDTVALGHVFPCQYHSTNSPPIADATCCLPQHTVKLSCPPGIDTRYSAHATSHPSHLFAVLRDVRRVAPC